MAAEPPRSRKAVGRKNANGEGSIYQRQSDGRWVGHIAFAGRDVSLAVQTYKPEPLCPQPAGPPRDIESRLARLPALSFEAQ